VAGGRDEAGRFGQAGGEEDFGGSPAGGAGQRFAAEGAQRDAGTAGVGFDHLTGGAR
jgi:hypothetical protein